MPELRVTHSIRIDGRPSAHDPVERRTVNQPASEIIDEDGTAGHFASTYTVATAAAFLFTTSVPIDVTWDGGTFKTFPQFLEGGVFCLMDGILNFPLWQFRVVDALDTGRLRGVVIGTRA